MKHKHHDMIVAKAENMDLVVFTKLSDKWITLCDWPTWDEDAEYFLCHPKHKEACLHWLNGGDVQLSNKGDFYNVSSVSLRCINGWSLECAFMDDSRDTRIKPRKEKRHIYISTLGATTYAKKTKEDAAREVSIMGGSFGVWKHYEVEVEV